MKWICPNCEYVYDEQKGHPREGWPAGTRFADIDPQWACPDCGVREQVDFVALTEPGQSHGKNTMGENA
jgi:rubredoxin